ncbi:hypothetical protein B9Z55_008933 [Caenorhabditis nigoni]|uniref:Uncharacterized protein n=1 Tax=Caenorhabditis nigoni TaxID=1611254 RepID=A0A2G5UQ31_9PELO|nr:hypothetical protein B9Z55_008933 [Caenorhabditis nigoni]
MPLSNTENDETSSTTVIEDPDFYESDDSDDGKLASRENHTFNWIKRIAKSKLDEYFDCVPFYIRDDEQIGTYMTNLKNEDDEIVKSPAGDVPLILDPEELIDDVYESAIPRITVTEKERGWFFTVMAGLNISHAMGFPFVMMRFGGWYFLIPFLLTTIFLTIALNTVHYCLGQYTNMPPTVIFHRWAPIFSGVGLLVTVVQFISSACIRFDHRFVSMALDLFYSLTAIRPPYDGPSMIQGRMNAYRPICQENEIFHENQCLSMEHAFYREGKSDFDFFEFKILKNLQSDQFVVGHSTADLPPNRIFDSAYAHAHFISAATILAIFLFLVSLLLVEKYFTRIQHVVFYGMIVTCTLTCVHLVWKWDRNATIFIHVIGTNFSKLGEFKTWVNAAIHSMMIFGTVDACYISIGAVNAFENRPFLDLLRAKFFGFFALVLIFMTFGMTAVIGATIYMQRIEKRMLNVDDFRIILLNDEQIYEFLYVYFFQNMASKLLMLILIAVFCLWQMSSLMLLARGSVDHIYRLIKSSSRLPEFAIRYIVLIFHCATVLFIHLFLSAMIIFDMQQNGWVLAKRTVIPVFIFGLFQIMRYRFVYSTPEAFKVSPKLRPTLLKSFAEFKLQEKAINGKADMLKKKTMAEKFKNLISRKKKMPTREMSKEEKALEMILKKEQRRRK